MAPQSFIHLIVAFVIIMINLVYNNRDRQCLYFIMSSVQMSMEQVTLADLLEHFTKDDLNSLGIKYVSITTTVMCPTVYIYSSYICSQLDSSVLLRAKLTLKNM